MNQSKKRVPVGEAREHIATQSAKGTVDATIALSHANSSAGCDKAARLMELSWLGWTRVTPVCMAMAALLIVASPGAPAQTATTPRSDAPTDSYASVWGCERGFQRAFQEGGKESCVAVTVPSNAYLDASGSDWDCNRGYVKNDQGCAVVKLPANAHSSEVLFGNGWQCDRGFRREQEHCVLVIVPAHAYALNDNDGPGWSCERGYRRADWRADARCEAVAAPANGFLTDRGDDWECGRGFARQGDSCAAVAIPANGFLDAEGHSWICERGFHRQDSKCIALIVPRHGYLDYSGHDWTCESGFRQQGDTCAAEK